MYDRLTGRKQIVTVVDLRCMIDLRENWSRCRAREPVSRVIDPGWAAVCVWAAMYDRLMRELCLELEAPGVRDSREPVSRVKEPVWAAVYDRLQGSAVSRVMSPLRAAMYSRF